MHEEFEIVVIAPFVEISDHDRHPIVSIQIALSLKKFRPRTLYDCIRLLFDRLGSVFRINAR